MKLGSWKLSNETLGQLHTLKKAGGEKARLSTAYLGGGFKYFLFSSLFGEDSHFD